jgi:hypothetical protein
MGGHAGVEQGVGGGLDVHGAMIPEGLRKPQIQMGAIHTITGREIPR